MAKTISNAQLTPGKFVYVKGKVGYSRIGRQTNDEELKRFNQGRKFEQKTPITQLTIYDAEVICDNPNSPSVEELYVMESLYTSSKKEYTGKCYNPVNKTKNLPAVKVQSAADRTKYDDYDMGGRELAQGTDVVIGMRTFKGNGNNGISLDHIIVMGELKLRPMSDNGAAKSALAKFGITFTNEPSPLNNETVAEAGTPEDGEDDTAVDDGAPAPTANPFANNAPAAAPAQTANPFANAAPATSNNPFNNVGAGTKRQY